MKFALYCSCGGCMKGVATPNLAAQRIIELWGKAHSGLGHTPVDSNIAARARRKAEKEAGIAYSIDNYADLED